MGYVLMLGIGIVFVISAIVWAAYLAYTRTPGIRYAFSTLAVIAALLLGAWAIF